MNTKKSEDLKIVEMYRAIKDTYRRIDVLELTQDRVVHPATYLDSILIDTLYMNVYRVLEEATNLSFETQFKYAHIPWSQLRGMRNRFAHDYGTVDPKVVWESIQEGFPELLKMAEGYMAEHGLTVGDA